MALGSSRSPQFYAITSPSGGVPDRVRALLDDVATRDRAYFQAHPGAEMYSRKVEPLEFFPLMPARCARQNVICWGSPRMARTFSRGGIDACAVTGAQDRFAIWRALESLGEAVRVIELTRADFRKILSHICGMGEYWALSEKAALMVPGDSIPLYEFALREVAIETGGELVSLRGTKSQHDARLNTARQHKGAR